MDLLIATQNKGKLAEYKAIFADLSVRVVTLADVGLDKLDVEETGTTFTANAELKARAYAAASGLTSLADDSGLCVDALDGRPGVYSARYAGEGATDADRRAKLLRELADKPNDERGAYFACAIVVYDPLTDTAHDVMGRLDGTIASAESGGPHGFGYDALFIPDGYTVTLADIPPDEKNTISHRGRAAQLARPVIDKLASNRR